MVDFSTLVVIVDQVDNLRPVSYKQKQGFNVCLELRLVVVCRSNSSLKLHQKAVHICCAIVMRCVIITYYLRLTLKYFLWKHGVELQNQWEQDGCTQIYWCTHLLTWVSKMPP